MAPDNNKSKHQLIQELKKSESRFQDFFNNTPIGIFITDSSGRFHHINREMARILGASSPQEALDKFQDIASVLYVQPEKRKEFLHLLQKNGRVENFEFKAKRLDGRHIWLSASSRISERLDDDTFLIDGYAMDITSRKLAEKALSKSEERFKLALEASRDGIWDWDIPSGKVQYNTSYATMLGFSLGEVPADKKFWQSRVHPEDKERVLQANNTVIENQSDNFKIEFRMQAQNGDWRWILGHGKAVARGLDGRAVRMVGTHTDITSRKRVEENLRESERQLSTLMANLPGMAYRCLNDEYWTMEFISDGCFKLTGYKPADLVGNKTLAFAGLIHPDDRELVAEAVHAALKNNRNFEIEYRIICADGELKHVWEKGCGIYQDDELQKMEGFITDITDRKQAEDNLLESERQLSTLMANLPGMAYRCRNDELWTMVFVSNGCFELTGYRPVDLIDAQLVPYVQLIHPDDRKKVRETVTRALNDSNNFEIEYRITNSFGQIRHVWEKGCGIYHQGKLQFIEGFINDITDRKHAEETLRKSEERSRLALDATSDGLWDYGIADGSMYIGERFVNLLGYEWGELEPDMDIVMNQIHENDRARTWDLLQAYIKGEVDAYRNEFRMQTKDGGWVWILSRAKLVAFDDQGRPTRIVGTHSDITKRKLAEQKLQQALDRISFHVENSPLAVIEWDHGTHIRTWSSRAETMFGWTAEEVIGKNWDDFAFTHPEDRDEVVGMTRRLFEGKEVFNTTQNRNLRKDGSVVHCQWFNSALVDASGRMVTILSQVADITELRKALSDLATAKDQAEAANRAKSEFLANMSHELRTPLNGIMGMHQLLMTTPLDMEQRDYVDKAVQSAKRLTNLLGDIIDISKVEAGKMDVVSKPFNLHETMQLVRQLFLPSCEQKRILLQFQVDESIPASLLGDNARLLQILNNLVGNAIKFTDSGSVDVSASPLPATKDGRYRILIMVKDTGIGIEENMIDALFGAFTQAAEGFRRQYQGAGLGLSIVKALVHLMDGTLSVVSEPDKGTTFYCSLPFELTEHEQAAPTTLKEAVSANLAALEVLLAEDEITNRIALSKLLEKKGCRVIGVSNGRQAIEALQKQHFDVVLMDIQMPVMDGVETVKAIRDGNAGMDKANVPVIALTAYAMAGDKDKFLHAGMNDYLSKPVELGALQNILSRVVGLARSRD